MLLAVEGEARDFDQQCVVRQCGRVRRVRLDDLALLQVGARDDEIGGGHGCDPGFFLAAIFAFV